MRPLRQIAAVGNSPRSQGGVRCIMEGWFFWRRMGWGPLQDIAGFRAAVEIEPCLISSWEVRGLDRWDLLIVAVAAYVAIMALVRLMAVRRDHLVGQVRRQIEQQRARQGQAETTEAEADGGTA